MSHKRAKYARSIVKESPELFVGNECEHIEHERVKLFTQVMPNGEVVLVPAEVVMVQRKYPPMSARTFIRKCARGMFK